MEYLPGHMHEVNNEETSLQNWRIRNTTSNYHEVLAKGLFLPMQPYTRHRQDSEHPHVQRIQTYYGRTTTVTDENASRSLPYRQSPVDLYSPSLDQAFNDAKIKINKKIRNSEFSLGVTLVEAGKTASLVTGTATKLTQSVLALKRGRIDKAFRIWGGRPPPRHVQRKLRNRVLYPRHYGDTVLNVHMELSYGWRPLLGDVFNAANAAALLSHERNDDIIIRAGSESKDTYFNQISGNEYYRGYPLPWTRSNDWRWKAKCHLAYRIRVNESRPSSILGLDNPAFVAWESLPGSFVADWFVPIGEWLQNRTIPTGVHLADSCRSNVVTCSGQDSFDGCTTANSRGYTRVFGAFTNVKLQRFERTSVTDHSVDRPRSKDLSDMMNVGKTLTSIALLRNTLSRVFNEPPKRRKF